MKKLSTLILMIVVCGAVWGQTNQYPTTGNVSIFQGASGVRSYDVFNYNSTIVSRLEAAADKSGQLWLKNASGDVKVYFKTNGNPSYIMNNLGIGTSNPTGKLHVSSSTDGDAIFLLEADTDNNNESDNPMIQLRQDGGTLGINMGFNESVFGGNIFGIGRKYSNKEYNNVLLMNTANGNISIGKSPTNAKLEVAGNIIFDDPNKTDDWNLIWQCGFFEGHNKPNSPEANQWYWGINMGHGSNNPDYRYGGQIAIRNSSTTPTMYFRSRDKNGDGYWAKVLHNKGNQRIEGNLTINGQIFSEEIEVKDIAANNITYTASGNTADFVFEDNYQLKDLTEVEAYIKANKHLPEIPSASEMEEAGVNLAEMNKLLLMKVEELTLYSIEQEKKIEERDEKVESLELKVEELSEDRRRETEEMKERLAKLEALFVE